jgi:hypothetical protein
MFPAVLDDADGVIRGKAIFLIELSITVSALDPKSSLPF